MIFSNFFIYLPNFHFNRKVFPHSALAQNRKSFGNKVMCTFFNFGLPSLYFDCFLSKRGFYFLENKQNINHNHIFSYKGHFVWLSGQPFTYTSWRTGEPSSSLDQKCYGVHTWKGDFGWNDAVCSITTYLRSKFRPLCKKEKSTGTGKCGHSILIENLNHQVYFPKVFSAELGCFKWENYKIKKSNLI